MLGILICFVEDFGGQIYREPSVRMYICGYRRVTRRVPPPFKSPARELFASWRRVSYSIHAGSSSSKDLARLTPQRTLQVAWLSILHDVAVHGGDCTASPEKQASKLHETYHDSDVVPVRGNGHADGTERWGRRRQPRVLFARDGPLQALILQWISSPVCRNQSWIVSGRRSTRCLEKEESCMNGATRYLTARKVADAVSRPHGTTLSLPV